MSVFNYFFRLFKKPQSFEEGDRIIYRTHLKEYHTGILKRIQDGKGMIETYAWGSRMTMWIPLRNLKHDKPFGE